MKVDGQPPPAEEFDGHTFLPMGSPDEVREQISAHLSGIDWSNPFWGNYDTGNLSIEIDIGKDDPVVGVWLVVRGEGEPVPVIMQFVKPLGWLAFDQAAASFLDVDHPERSSWNNWQAYRDQVTNP